MKSTAHKVLFKFVDEKAASGDVEARQLLTPKRASQSAAGYDLVASNLNPIEIKPGQRALVPTGVAIALPENFEAQVRPRSGLALKNGITVLNAPGTIDADYRGEVGVILVNLGSESFVVTRGIRIAQLVIAQVETPEFEMSVELPESFRGAGGFGSTGVQKEISAAQ